MSEESQLLWVILDHPVVMLSVLDVRSRCCISLEILGRMECTVQEYITLLRTASNLKHNSSLFLKISIFIPQLIACNWNHKKWIWCWGESITFIVPSHRSLSTTDLFTVSIVLPCSESHKLGIMQYVAFFI